LSPPLVIFTIASQASLIIFAQAVAVTDILPEPDPVNAPALIVPESVVVTTPPDTKVTTALEIPLENTLLSPLVIEENTSFKSLSSLLLLKAIVYLLSE
jgi:hypothetical protein